MAGSGSTQSPSWPESLSLEGRVVIVTGASSGLGEEIARAMAAAGATLVVAGRREDALVDFVREVGGSHVAGDLARGEDREALVSTALSRHGRVDVLVNNAGVSRPGPAENDDDAGFRAALELNLVAPFALARLVAPGMLARGEGSIVNVASILGLVAAGQIPDAGYAASKGGLVNLTRELAAQWASRGVRVNAIAPGFFPTGMTSTLLDHDSGHRWVERRTPMGRPGRTGEVGGAVVFLSSPASSYITGQVLAIDGGWTAI